MVGFKFPDYTAELRVAIKDQELRYFLNNKEIDEREAKGFLGALGEATASERRTVRRGPEDASAPEQMSALLRGLVPVWD